MSFNPVSLDGWNQIDIDNIDVFDHVQDPTTFNPLSHLLLDNLDLDGLEQVIIDSDSSFIILGFLPIRHSWIGTVAELWTLIVPNNHDWRLNSFEDVMMAW